VLIGAPIALTLIGRPAADWVGRRVTVALPLLATTALLATDKAVLAAPVGEACAAGRVEPLPAFAARLARLGRERFGLAVTVVSGVFSPVANEGRMPKQSSSRRLPQERAEEVAARLHFSSEFYFSHFFRKASGMSPTQFRREPKG
jgi:AraC-like DNA-binding protein